MTKGKKTVIRHYDNKDIIVGVNIENLCHYITDYYASDLKR